VSVSGGVGGRGAPVVLGFSGADGAGKSSVVTAIGESLPVPAIRVYLYGCIVCRRRPASAGATLRRRGWDGATGRVPGIAAQIVRSALVFHGLVDALALELNLRRAIRSAGTPKRVSREDAAPSGIVLSDRSPLDGLAKHDPPVGSLRSRWYLRLGRRYEAILWLDAPPEVLAGRDTDHSAAELQQWRNRFARWAAHFPNAIRIDASQPLAQVVGDVVAAVGPLSSG
jgi:thymidylate kinase